MIFSLSEIIDILLMSAVLGYVFMGYFKVQHSDPLVAYMQKFDYQSFLFAIAITAPAIILHEFGHKFLALAFGFTATFQAAYLWLGLAVILRAIGSSFIFLVPAYVSWAGDATALQVALVAFAGPAVNGLLALGSWMILKLGMLTKWERGLRLTLKINLLLFGFNLIPIPGFDGFHFFRALFSIFFG